MSSLVLTLIYLGVSENLRVDLPPALLFGALVVFVASRFGILALYATFLVFDLMVFFPFTLDFSHWYAGRSLFVLLIIVGPSRSVDSGSPSVASPPLELLPWRIRATRAAMSPL